MCCAVVGRCVEYFIVDDSIHDFFCLKIFVGEWNVFFQQTGGEEMENECKEGCVVGGKRATFLVELLIGFLSEIEGIKVCDAYLSGKTAWVAEVIVIGVDGNLYRSFCFKDDL